MPSIIFINRYFYPDHSATSQILSDLAFHLGANMDVKVITSRQLYNSPGQLLAKRENVNSVTIKRVWTTRFGRGNLVGRGLDYLTFYVSALFILLFTVRSGDYVVAKTDPPLISVVALLVTKLKSARLINWNQDLFPEVGTELGIRVLTYMRPLLIWVRNLALRGGYMNVVIGETMKDRLLSFGVNNDKISVIPNWSDGEKIYPITRESNLLRKEWGLNDKFVVGYSGNMGRAHEFETILALAQSLKGYSDIVFLFIGEGAKKAWIQQQVNERQLNNVIFKPYQSRDNLGMSLSLPDIHLISLLPAMEGLIVPSKYYGVAAAGRPCLFVGDQQGEISRIIMAHDCGLVIDIGEIQAGIEYILDLKENPDKKCMQGENARKIFDRAYDVRIAFESWEALLPEGIKQAVRV